MLHPDEINVQNESIGELRSVDSTQDDDVGNYDEVEDIIDTQITTRGVNLRPTRKRNYSNMQLLQDAVIVINDARAKESAFKHLTGIIMTQISTKSVIKNHGKLSIDALINDFFQLDDKTVFEGIMEKDLTI